MRELREGQKWRHCKRGGEYEILHTGCGCQCSSLDGTAAGELIEAEAWVAYRSVQGHQVFFRMEEEFLDGRFELIEDVK